MFVFEAKVFTMSPTIGDLTFSRSCRLLSATFTGTYEIGPQSAPATQHTQGLLKVLLGPASTSQGIVCVPGPGQVSPCWTTSCPFGHDRIGGLYVSLGSVILQVRSGTPARPTS